MTLSSERTGDLYLNGDIFLEEIPGVGLVKFEVNGYTQGLGGNVTISCGDERREIHINACSKVIIFKVELWGE